jgi:uncharacterized membrane protein
MRDFLLLGHITFAMVWIGSHLLLVVLARRARQGGPADLVGFVADSRWLAWWLQGPAAFLVLLFGIVLMFEDGFVVTEWWILLGLAGFAVLFGVAATYLLPECREILALAEKYGPDAADVQHRIGRVVRTLRIDSGLMVLIVLDMIVKPGL